jgi:hypothetical protein
VYERTMLSAIRRRIPRNGISSSPCTGVAACGTFAGAGFAATGAGFAAAAGFGAPAGAV